jgi:hypothetical protein
LLLDEASLLACAAYVDLNPVRAAIAETPEKSSFTGAKDRIDDHSRTKKASRTAMHRQERNRPGPKSGWMSPIEENGSSDPVGPDACDGGRRASCKGFLPLSLGEYLELLDWTGRHLRGDKRGSIPVHLAPILERIGVDSPGWCGLVKEFGRTFKRVAGTSEHLAEEAKRRGQHWVQAPGNPLAIAE